MQKQLGNLDCIKNYKMEKTWKFLLILRLDTRLWQGCMNPIHCSHICVTVVSELISSCQLCRHLVAGRYMKLIFYSNFFFRIWPGKFSKNLIHFGTNGFSLISEVFVSVFDILTWIFDWIRIHLREWALHFTIIFSFSLRNQYLAIDLLILSYMQYTLTYLHIHNARHSRN